MILPRASTYLNPALINAPLHFQRRLATVTAIDMSPRVVTLSRCLPVPDFHLSVGADYRAS